MHDGERSSLTKSCPASSVPKAGVDFQLVFERSNQDQEGAENLRTSVMPGIKDKRTVGTFPNPNHVLQLGSGIPSER
jgi:hypothetical protein